MHPTTELVIPEVAEIAALDTPRLRAELSRALTITAHGLAYLAAVWAELERRGEDLSDLRSGLAVYLPAIAAGRLAPEAVVQFAGQSTLLRRVMSLPVDEQRRLAAGEPLPVVVATPDGELVERRLPARALAARQIAQVFDDYGRVRTPIEQRQVAQQQRRPPARPASAAAVRGALAVLSTEDLQQLAEERGLTLAPKCAAAGCSRPAHVKGLCQRHYSRSRQPAQIAD